MTIYLPIYVIGHLLSAVLIGIMLGRLHLVLAWAAWAFALASPLTILLFPVHNLVFQDVLKYLICALLIIGAIPAALAMLKNKDLALPAPSPAKGHRFGREHHERSFFRRKCVRLTRIQAQG
jgi:hypothetical protein